MTTSDRQFGFRKQLKKGVGCNFAIRSVRNVVDTYVAHGNTANLHVCATDVSKEFDKVNHFALLSKLMKRFVSDELLLLLESWLAACHSCIRWDNSCHRFYAQFWR